MNSEIKTETCPTCGGKNRLTLSDTYADRDCGCVARAQAKVNAANTPFLGWVKRVMNSKIYKHTLNIYRTQGRTEAEKYLQQFFNKPLASVIGSPLWEQK